MEIPIFIDDRKAGVLHMERRGSWTLLRGEMENPGRLVRLCLYGEREVYLGVPQPEGERLVYCRRFTPREMCAFPRCPEYAAEHRRQRNEPSPEPAEEKRHVVWMGGKPYFF